MSIFEHSRIAIYTQAQHLLQHPVSDFYYSNPAMPGVSNVETALNWILAVMYPNTKASVANVAALPAVGNTINDYRVVLDDGDGKAASYRWEQREGEAVASWHKVYDMDWGESSILSHFTNVTNDLYVSKYGCDDKDKDGVALAGALAGQHIYGGVTASTHLTLHANSGDGVGAQTGYIQIADNFRPTTDSAYSLGTTTERFLKVWTDEITIGTMTITGGSLTDSSGTVNFGDDNITTTGTITGNIIDISGAASFGNFTFSDIAGPKGQIAHDSGTISFDNENLETTGTITGATGSKFGNLTLADGSITSTGGAISFGDENLSTTGTLGAGVTTVEQLNVNDIRLDGHAISVQTADTSLDISANGTGVVNITSALTTIGQTVTGTVAITGRLDADNVRVDGNTISSTNADGNVIVDPNGSGLIELGAAIFPTTTSAWDIGKTGNVWNKLWLDGAIGDGVDEILTSELYTLRNVKFRDAARTQAVGAGDTLFWDAVSGTWLASAPDTEIVHSGVSGLTTGDAGHTQFVMLAGRAGGQTIQGGTLTTQNLTLQANAADTTGNIFFSNTILPTTNASYSSGWSGLDVGDATHYIKDVYSKGEFKGFRLENYTAGTLPAASAQNTGRLVYSTDNKKIYADAGGSWVIAGVGKFESDTSWNGTDVTKDVDVSATIADARKAIWALLDNANDFERIYCSLKAINATTVRITVELPLDAGSYRLLGVE